MHGVRRSDQIPRQHPRGVVASPSGRCRDCGTAISARYLIVEATTAALFVAAALVIGVAWVLPAYWWFVAVGVALVLTDIDHKRIPNRILFPGIIVGAVLLTIGAVGDGADAGGGLEPFIRAGAGGAAYFTGLLVLALIARGALVMSSWRFSSECSLPINPGESSPPGFYSPSYWAVYRQFSCWLRVSRGEKTRYRSVLR